jgi:MFS family permease
MTIYVRNRFVLASFALAAGTVLAVLFLLVYGIFAGTLAPPPEGVTSLSFNAAGAVFSYSFAASLAAIGFCALSAPVLIMFIYANFEKTQSQECVYGIAFLLACLAEAGRLLIPVFGLWTVQSSLFITISRFVFFGRLLAPMSFLICSLTSVGTKQYQESGKYFIMLVAFAGVFAFVIPVNSLHLTANCDVVFGFSRIIFIYQVILFVITLAAFAAFGKTQEKKDTLMLALGYLLFFSGYRILMFADSVFFVVLGASLFIAGMDIFLGRLHKIYMWD